MAQTVWRDEPPQAIATTQGDRSEGLADGAEKPLGVRGGCANLNSRDVDFPRNSSMMLQARRRL